MNKKELVTALVEQSGQTKQATEAVLDAFQTVIGDTLAKGESVVMVGFGTFSVRERAARQGRNPQTGEPIEIAAARVPNFKPGTILREKVR